MGWMGRCGGRGRIQVALGLGLLVLVASACRAIFTPTPGAPTETAPPTLTATPTPVPATLALTDTPAQPTATAPPTLTATPTPVPPTLAQPTATLASTRTPVPPTDTPPPSPTPTAQAVIHYFRARASDGTLVTLADPGETIILEWSWSGGTEATIYHLFGGQLSTPWWAVGPSGTQEYTISSQARNYDRFVLFVGDAAGVLAEKTLEIPLSCPDEWFFSPTPDVCPAGPAIVTDGAEQRFQHGVMLWNRAEDRIYVLFDDGGIPDWQAYEDRFEEGDPESDPTIEPPPGLYQPIRGFGLVWREQPGVRDRLGWAVAPETGYETAIQRTSYIKYNDTYIRALDGGVWRLGPEGSEWEHIP
jgi:hypothetical protein